MTRNAKAIARCVSTRAAWFGSIVLAGLTASFALWNPLETYERAQVSRTTHQTMESLRADLRSDMQARLFAQVRLAEIWGIPFSEKDRELSSTLFLGHHAGYLMLEWADRTGRVLCAVGRDGPEDPDTTGFGTAETLRAMRLPPPRLPGEAIVTHRFSLPDGRPALRVIVPVVRQDTIAGFLVAIVDIPATLDNMVDDHKDLGYSVSVAEGPTGIYQMPGNQHEYEARFAEQGMLQLPGVAWTVRVWPKPEILSHARSSLPKIAMVLGGLLGSVLMLAIHFARAARGSSRELQRAHDELEQRVKERTLELEEVNNALQTEVGDRKRAEDSYRDLSGSLLRLQDEERRRIARDLHDSTAQMLGALAINVDRSRTLAQTGDLGRLAGVLSESGEFVEEITQEIRTVSYLLHPPMLDDLGLEYVLPWYAGGFSQRSGIVTSLDIQPNLGRFSGDIELTFFRMVQEALANVRRHSGSPSVSIRLFRDAESATLEVRDQGSGLPRVVLDALAGSKATAPIGVGIAGMRERVRQLKGRMSISSGDDGTILRTVLPLIEPADDRRETCCGPACGCPVCGSSASVAARDGYRGSADLPVRVDGDAAA